MIFSSQPETQPNNDRRNERRNRQRNSEDKHVNQEEGFKEDFDHAADGAMHWLPLLLPGLREARAQASVVGYSGHPNRFFWWFVHWI
jgi:hypothetical protein